MIGLLVVLALSALDPALVARQHSQHPQPQHPQPQQPPKPVTPPAKPAEDHSAHRAQQEPAAARQPDEPLPAVTDADRLAAFPPGLDGHAVHDRAFMTFVLVDQLEWKGGESGGINLESTSWFGGDINRLWVRAKGESEEGTLEKASVDALWGHSFSRWWDIVGGIRQDVRPGDPQTWAAIGIQGLAPMWFEIEATGYVGAGGRTHARFEAEYDLLLTNRLVLQPLLEVDVYGKADPARGLGAGISSIESGVRLRYEIRRELAPYVGITWDRKLFGTADIARSDGGDVSKVRLALGLRTWF